MLVAVFGLGGASGSAVGVGTIFGEPFIASSVSYGLVGVFALFGFYLKRRKHSYLEVSQTLTIPFIFVTIFFPLALIPSIFNSFQIRILFGLLFFTLYFAYLGLMYRQRTLEIVLEAKYPYFSKIISNKEIASIVQLAISVIILYLGADQLVSRVKQISISFGTSLIGLSLIIIPAATAIPETASALIWGFRGKDTLSIGSLVGEKVLYSTLYPAIGLFITTWILDIHVYISVIATVVVSLLMLLFISKKKIPWYGLTFGLVFFTSYVLLIFLMHI